jgi:hypothetical protein
MVQDNSWGIILASHIEFDLSDVKENEKHGDNASGLQSQQMGKSLPLTQRTNPYSLCF